MTEDAISTDDARSAEEVDTLFEREFYPLFEQLHALARKHEVLFACVMQFQPLSPVPVDAALHNVARPSVLLRLITALIEYYRLMPDKEGDA